jgi:predicted dienelactone hydrolase
MLKKLLKILGGLLALVLVLGIAVFVATGPQAPDSNSSSAEWLQPGPHRVATAEFTFVDSSRATSENRGAPGKPERTLPTTIWYPQQLDGALPLIIHSHGIVSNRQEVPYLMEALASRGYIVAAADYPLTSGNTEGGANGNDVVNQPADIAFLIDSIIALQGDEKPFAGSIDSNRIGLTGYSLGGLTTYLTTYHPQWRDRRVAAGVAIAGPSAPFTPAFFASTDIPFLAISGTADALIEHRRNAADIPQRAPNASLVTIEGGSHLGFAGISDPTFRFMDNPDTLGCQAVLAVLDESPDEIFVEMSAGSPVIDVNRDMPGICDYGFADTTHPGRQQMITEVAIVSFFESVFSTDAAVRDAAAEQLTVALARDFEEVQFVP